MKKEFKRIFLIGYMGAGKTSLGKELAKHLEHEFIDTDEEIEKKMGKPITKIFDEEGEEYFRKQEHELIKVISQKKKNLVCSTGGGLPCFYNNMELMNKAGVTVYLNCKAEELHNRLKNNKTHRPILSRESHALLSFITDELKKRDAFYSQSKLLINTGGNPISSLISTIINSLN